MTYPKERAQLAPLNFAVNSAINKKWEWTMALAENWDLNFRTYKRICTVANCQKIMIVAFIFAIEIWLVRQEIKSLANLDAKFVEFSSFCSCTQFLFCEPKWMNKSNRSVSCFTTTGFDLINENNYTINRIKFFLKDNFYSVSIFIPWVR